MQTCIYPADATATQWRNDGVAAASSGGRGGPDSSILC